MLSLKIITLMGVFLILEQAVLALEVPQKDFPLPDMASPELQELIRDGYFPWWNTCPANPQEWKSFMTERARAGKEALNAIKAKLQVSSAPQMMGNAPAHAIMSDYITPENRDRALLYPHGGGFVPGPGDAGSRRRFCFWTRLKSKFSRRITGLLRNIPSLLSRFFNRHPGH